MADEGHVYESPENYGVMRAAFERDSRLYRYVELPGTHHLHMLHPDPVAHAINTFLGDCAKLGGLSAAERNNHCMKRKADHPLVDGGSVVNDDQPGSSRGYCTREKNRTCKNSIASDVKLSDANHDADDTSRSNIANSDGLCSLEERQG